jgi:phage shock protein A
LNNKIKILQGEIKKIEKDTNELSEILVQVTQSIKETDKSINEKQNEHKKLYERFNILNFFKVLIDEGKI